jgi:hypothetical protein
MWEDGGINTLPEESLSQRSPDPHGPQEGKSHIIFGAQKSLKVAIP